MLKESLPIYTIDEHGNKVTFPSEQEHAVMSKWNYSAERMAGAPTITGSLMHRLCLDELWDDKEFVELNGERYYVDQTPTSAKSAEDIRYKHDITFVGERISLENVFFFDVVTSETEEQYKDRYRSNSTKFSFYGTLNEFVSRLNDSLIYTKLYNPSTGEGYHIVIDEGISVSEGKEISLENVYFATALQEIYNKFKIPYYWIGKICHVGYAENSIAIPFEYGQGNGLVAITKQNENFRIINRITGKGSSENIPYYYPNLNEYGEFVFSTENIEKSRVANFSYRDISGYNPSVFDTYTFCKRTKRNMNVNNGLKYYNPLFPQQDNPVSFQISLYPYKREIENRVPVFYYKSNVDIYFRIHAKKGAKITTSSSGLRTIIEASGIAHTSYYYLSSRVHIQKVNEDSDWVTDRENEIEINDTYYFLEDGYYQLAIHGIFNDKRGDGRMITKVIEPYLNLLYDLGEDNMYFFTYAGGEKDVSYSESGIILSGFESVNAKEYISDFADGEMIDTLIESSANPAKITITERKWITPTGNLMPPIYRESNGAERFYNAENDTYDSPDGGKYIFKNPYTSHNPMEGIQDFDDIKPSIKGMKNESGQLIGEIADIAFDSDDSDDKTSDSNGNNLEYVHSYFYVKLHLFNGTYGFNLFKQALESGAMTFNMTSGNCAGCAFELGVSKPRLVDGHYEFDNPVQVDENGNIVSGNYDDKVQSSNIQPRQQDTSKYEVWVALKKENSTYGVVMPNATNNYKPSVGDTFVITNILMPHVYITHAENELKEALIKSMSENNDEKFSFSITLSRIYLQQNPDIASKLNENARIIVRYNGHDYTLYVSSYSCIASDDVLNEIKIDVTSDFSVGKSALRDKIAEVAHEVINGNSSQDYLALAQKYFLSKTQRDIASRKITFNEGIGIGPEENGYIDGNANAELLSLVVREMLRSPKFVNGFTGEGWRLWLENGLSKLELDELTVRRVMHVFELIIERIRSVGGQIIVSAANGKISKVEDEGERYRIYFEEGENYYQAHDLLRCQTFTGNDIRGYWVEVENSFADYITVSKSEFDDVEPLPGDETVLMGNTTNTLRQNLISISATEDGQPRIDVLNGVKSKNFEGCLRSRFGNLDGISDDWFPIDNQPHGDGLYADNAYLKGTFLLTTGEDIKTKFEIVEGKIQSSIESVSQGYLANPSFTDGLNKWSCDDVVFFLFGTKWIWANNNALSGNGGIEVVDDNGRIAVLIKHGAIVQKFRDFSSLPEISTNDDGLKEPATVSLSFFYKVKKKGRLVVGFRNSLDYEQFVEYEPFSYSKELDVTDGYKQLTITGLWDGTGDFSFLFTGEIYVSMLVLSDDRIGSLTQTYKTLFEQSDRLVQISAAMFGDDKTLLKQAGLVVKPNGAGLYAFDSNGALAVVGTYTQDGSGVVLLKGDKIRLEGNITADGNVKIREDGSIEANNGSFSGFVKKSKTVITEENIDDFLKFEINYYILNFEKTGSYVIFDGNFRENYISLHFKGNLSGMNTSLIDNGIDYIGSNIIIYNQSNLTINLIGSAAISGDLYTKPSPLESGHFSYLECVAAVNSDGYGIIYWKENVSGKFYYNAN